MKYSLNLLFVVPLALLLPVVPVQVLELDLLYFQLFAQLVVVGFLLLQQQLVQPKNNTIIN